MTTRKPLLWQGKAVLGNGWAWFTGDSGDNTPHQHLAVQLVIAHKDDVHVNIAEYGQVASPAIVIAANIKHQLLPGSALVLYLDPESGLGRALSQRCRTGFLKIDNRVRNLILADSQNQIETDWFRALEKHLGLSVVQIENANLSDRVHKLILSLPARSEIPKRLGQLAAETSLSPSRLRHRLSAVAGMPFRAYMRWLRLQRALAFAASGASLTAAAHGAGFSDVAHLTRTMRRHFGVAPRDVLKALRMSQNP